MKLLLVLDNLSSNCGANVGIAFELMKKWNEAGHSIYCLTREDKYHEIDTMKAEALDEVWSFSVCEDDIINDFTKDPKWINASPLTKIKLLATHPVVLSKMIDKKYFETSEIKREYVAQIKKICENNKFDAIIAVTEPYYIADALAQVETCCDKYTIMMDPYTNSPSTTSKNRNKKLEKELRVFEANKKVFTLDFVGNDMDYLPAECRGKIVKFYIPKIQIRKDSEENVCHTKAKNEEITFVYVGLLYEDIRNPELMFKIFDKLPDNYKLHFYGGGADRIVNEYKEILKDKLICHGWVSAEEAKKATNEADILINLNNNISNMLPSKIVDYIDSGKPILNICQINNCPSLEYTKKYPMKVDILPGEDVTEARNKVVEFTNNYAGKVTQHSDIEEIYHEYTSEYAAKFILENIEK